MKLCPETKVRATQLFRIVSGNPGIDVQGLVEAIGLHRSTVWERVQCLVNANLLVVTGAGHKNSRLRVYTVPGKDLSHVENLCREPEPDRPYGAGIGRYASVWQLGAAAMGGV